MVVETFSVILFDCVEFIGSHLVLSAGAVLLLALYLYSTWTYDYWVLRDIPQLTPLPLIGSLWHSLRYTEDQWQCRSVVKYGKVFGGYTGRKPVLYVADADVFRLICVKDFHHFVDRSPQPFADKFFEKMLTSLTGDDWKRVRSVISPTFSSGKLRRMFPLMDDCVSDLLDQIDDSLGGGEILLKEVYGNFTMDVIARCAFAIRTRTKSSGGKSESSESEFVVHAKKFFSPSPLRILPLLLLPLRLTKALNLSVIGKEAVNFFTSSAGQIIAARRSKMAAGGQATSGRVDYLQLMLDAAESSKSNNNEDQETHHVTETEEEGQVYQETITQFGSGTASGGVAKKKYLNDDEILSQAAFFLVAGYETTSSVLSFATYSLATNPAVQERLYQELIQIQPDGGGGISYDALFQEAPYLDAVLNETLRLYTPLNWMDRLAVRDYRLGEPYNVTIKKGTSVFLCFAALHHDPEYWREPWKFNPERFLDSAEVRPYSFLPFGAGPRNCVAMRFALMEVKLALARLVLRYKFLPTTRTSPADKLNYSKMTNIRKLNEDLILGFEKRNTV